MASRASRRRRYWKERWRQACFVDAVGRGMGVERAADWTDSASDALIRCGGLRLVQIRGGAFQLLQGVYPEFLPLRALPLLKKPNHYWQQRSHQRSFMDHLGQTIPIRRLDDWKRISTDLLASNGGKCLLHEHGWSMTVILSGTYPEMNALWFPFQLRQVPKHFWQEVCHRRLLLEWISQRLMSYMQMFGDWYYLNSNEFGLLGGEMLLQGRSYLGVLCGLYPEFPWDPLHLPTMPLNFWSFEEHYRCLISKLQQYYALKQKKDFYRLSTQQISHISQRHLQSSTVFSIFQTAFPEEDWNMNQFTQNNKKSTQRWLGLQIERLYPHHLIQEEYASPHIKRKSGHPLEFDFYLPQLHLAFEFQGEQHYKEIPAAGFSSLSQRISLDQEKASLCQQHGITLIIIPYYWDRSLQSLMELKEKYFG